MKYCVAFDKVSVVKFIFFLFFFISTEISKLFILKADVNTHEVKKIIYLNFTKLPSADERTRIFFIKLHARKLKIWLSSRVKINLTPQIYIVYRTALIICVPISHLEITECLLLSATLIIDAPPSHFWKKACDSHKLGLGRIQMAWYLSRNIFNLSVILFWLPWRWISPQGRHKLNRVIISLGYFVNRSFAVLRTFHCDVIAKLEYIFLLIEMKNSVIN